MRCRTAVACSRGRVRRSLRTPVRHAASGQLVGVHRATARRRLCVQSRCVAPSVGTGCVAACSGSVACYRDGGRSSPGRPISSLWVPRQPCPPQKTRVEGFRVLYTKSARRCDCKMHSVCVRFWVIERAGWRVKGILDIGRARVLCFDLCHVEARRQRHEIHILRETHAASETTWSMTWTRGAATARWPVDVASAPVERGLACQSGGLPAAERRNGRAVGAVAAAWQ